MELGPSKQVWAFCDLLSLTPKQFYVRKIKKISEQKGSSCFVAWIPIDSGTLLVVFILDTVDVMRPKRNTSPNTQLYNIL